MATPKKPTPSPGTPARGSRTGRPIMALLDLLGRRWALRVLWELRETPASFRELQGLCDGLSPTILNVRLRELRDAGIVELTDKIGYRTTSSGDKLLAALAPLDVWAKSWAKRR